MNTPPLPSLVCHVEQVMRLQIVNPFTHVISTIEMYVDNASATLKGLSCLYLHSFHVCIHSAVNSYSCFIIIRFSKRTLGSVVPLRGSCIESACSENPLSGALVLKKYIYPCYELY